MRIPRHLLNDCVEHDNKVPPIRGINEGYTRGDCVMNTAAPQRGFHTLFKNRNFLLLWLEELTSALSLFNITFMLSQAIGFIVFAPIILSLLPSFKIANIPIFPAEVLYAIIA